MSQLMIPESATTAKDSKTHRYSLDEAIWHEYCAAYADGQLDRMYRAEVRLVAMLRRVGRSYLAQWFPGNNSQLVNDLAETALSLALRRVQSFQGQAKFTSYFHVICKNVKNSYLRTKRRQEPLDYGIDPDSVITGNPTNAMEAKILCDQLRRSLKPEDQKIFDMKLEGYTDAEVNAELGRPESDKACNRWHYLKQLLRKRLSEDGAKTSVTS